MSACIHHLQTPLKVRPQPLPVPRASTGSPVHTRQYLTVAQWSHMGHSQYQEKRTHLIEINSSPQRAGPLEARADVGALRPGLSVSHAPFPSFPLGQKSLQLGNNENILPKCLLPLSSSTVLHNRSLHLLFSSLSSKLLVTLQSLPQKSSV